MGRYVVDFAIHGRNLIIEVDGSPHEVFADAALRDRERDAWLASQGYRVLRFANTQVMDLMDEVLSAIHTAASPSSPLIQSAGRTAP